MKIPMESDKDRYDRDRYDEEERRKKEAGEKSPDRYALHVGPNADIPQQADAAKVAAERATEDAKKQREAAAKSAELGSDRAAEVRHRRADVIEARRDAHAANSVANHSHGSSSYEEKRQAAREAKEQEAKARFDYTRATKFTAKDENSLAGGDQEERAERWEKAVNVRFDKEAGTMTLSAKGKKPETVKMGHTSLESAHVQGQKAAAAYAEKNGMGPSPVAMHRPAASILYNSEGKQIDRRDPTQSEKMERNAVIAEAMAKRQATEKGLGRESKLTEADEWEKKNPDKARIQPKGGEVSDDMRRKADPVPASLGSGQQKAEGKEQTKEEKKAERAEQYRNRVIAGACERAMEKRKATEEAQKQQQPEQAKTR